MAKFTIDVELDWLDDETTVDEAIERQVIRGLQDRLLTKLESRFESEISERINEKVEKIADQFISQLMQTEIENIQIPYKENSWSSKVEYMTLSEFIGKQYKEAITEKTLNERGEKTSNRDRSQYSIIEYLTKDYIAKELNGKVVDMIREAKSKAEKSLISNLEANLQQQLNADMLKRLNIPMLLKNLQNTIEGEVIEE